MERFHSFLQIFQFKNENFKIVSKFGRTEAHKLLYRSKIEDLRHLWGPPEPILNDKNC